MANVLFLDEPTVGLDLTSQHRIQEFGVENNNWPAIFFSQSPSFLAHQRDMKRQRGRSNAESVFQMGQIPSDNHIRDLLDPTPASAYEAAYLWLWRQLKGEEVLKEYQFLGQHLLLGLDGIQFFSSTKIHCAHCYRQQIGETTHYSHRALTALVVHPEQSEVLPFIPDFILPQDGVEKQDSEIAAAKRWLARHQVWLREQKVIILGDDLFSHQPFCELLLAAKLGFILVCLPESHVTLYEWLEGIQRGANSLRSDGEYGTAVMEKSGVTAML